jgi:hypothetical protein
LSAQATGHVWKCCAFGGAKFLVLLGVADVVNTDHANVFWMTSTNLGNKVRMHPTNVRRHLKELVEDGWLEVLEPGGGNGKATKFRFHPLETTAPLSYTPKTKRIPTLDPPSGDMRLTASQNASLTKENLKELKAEPDLHVEKNDDSSSTHNASNLPSKNVRSGKHDPDTINNNLEGIRAIRKATRTDQPNETNTDGNK